MQDASEFSLAFSRAYGKVVVDIDGALDARNAGELRDRLVDVIDGQGNRQLVLDLARTTRIDSAGLSVLVDALKRIQKTGGELVLSGPTSHVARALATAGLDKVMVITPSWAHPAGGGRWTNLGKPAGWS